MPGGVKILYDRYQGLLTPEPIQLDYQRLRRLIQPPRAVEERPPHGPHVAALEVPGQRRRSRVPGPLRTQGARDTSSTTSLKSRSPPPNVSSHESRNRDPPSG